MRVFDMVVAALLIIGGLNWGLIGFFDFNVVAAILGDASALSRTLYALVGLGACYEVFSLTFGFKTIQHRWCHFSSIVRH